MRNARGTGADEDIDASTDFGDKTKKGQLRKGGRDDKTPKGHVKFKKAGDASKSDWDDFASQQDTEFLSANGAKTESKQRKKKNCKDAGT